MKPLMYPLLLGLMMTTAGLHAAGDDALIVPNGKIGHVVLGSDLTAAEERLGQPTSAKERTVTWVSKAVPPEEVAIVYEPNGETGRETVRQVSVTSAFFHTRAGNSVNSDLAALWREFPELHYVRYGDKGDTSHIQVYDSTEQGVAVMIQLNPQPAAGESWGRCRAIIVHRRGERPVLVDLGPTTAAKP